MSIMRLLSLMLKSGKFPSGCCPFFHPALPKKLDYKNISKRQIYTTPHVRQNSDALDSHRSEEEARLQLKLSNSGVDASQEVQRARLLICSINRLGSSKLSGKVCFFGFRTSHPWGRISSSQNPHRIDKQTSPLLQKLSEEGKIDVCDDSE